MRKDEPPRTYELKQREAGGEAKDGPRLLGERHARVLGRLSASQLASKHDLACEGRADRRQTRRRMASEAGR